MTDIITAAPAGTVACACACDPDVRVLRRVLHPADLPVTSEPIGPVRTVALIDTETTGTDTVTDEVIDIAYLKVTVDALGQLVHAVGSGQSLRDPGRPIPPIITKLTGLTDADVRGQDVNIPHAERVLSACDVLIAHNAAFDAPLVERLLPGLAGRAWACSASDYDWLENGWDGKKQNHLLMQAGWFNEAHRAMADVISLLHLLLRPTLGLNLTILGEVLAHSEQPTVLIEATGAPFDKRGELKARGYRWNAVGKVWWTEVATVDEAAEVRWLGELTPWGPEPHRRPITWHERHR